MSVVNKYASNIEALKYIKQILADMKGEIDTRQVSVRDSSTPLSTMDNHPGRKSVSKCTAPDPHFRLDVPTEHSTHSSSSIHILPKNTQNIFQERSCWATKQVLKNLKLKSCQASFLLQ